MRLKEVSKENFGQVVTSSSDVSKRILLKHISPTDLKIFNQDQSPICILIGNRSLPPNSESKTIRSFTLKSRH